MQTTVGTVSVTNGSARVIGTLEAADPDYGWTSLPVGSIFIVSGDLVPYFVAAKTAPGSSTSGFWEVTLSANYAGTTGTGLAYSFTTSFTTNFNLPLIARGDVETAILWNRMVGLLDALAYRIIPTLALGSGTAIDWAVSNYFSKTLSANTTFTFSNLTDGKSIRVAITNTASNYTVTWPTVRWPGGTAPTQTIGAKTDVYTFTKIGSLIYGSVSANHNP